MMILLVPVKLLLLFLWTPFVALMAAFVNKGGWGGVRRVTWFTRFWSRGILTIMNVKRRVHGGSPDFEGRLVISNHTSYLDILLHGATMRVRFASKKEVKNYFLLGAMLGTSRPVWVDRGSRASSGKALEEFRDSLRNRLNLIVYPEGTTTDGFHGLLPFKSTAFEAVSGTDFAIQPVITRTRLAKNGFNAAWYGDMTLMPHLRRLLTLPSLTSDIYLLPPQHPLAGEDRKALATRMHDYLENALKIIDSGDASATSALLSGN